MANRKKTEDIRPWALIDKMNGLVQGPQIYVTWMKASRVMVVKVVHHTKIIGKYVLKETQISYIEYIGKMGEEPSGKCL